MSRPVTRTGVVPMPKKGEKQLGGHAMLIVGYDDDRQVFIVRNSFGRKWGLQGYCLIPYAYIMRPDLTWAFWTIRRET